MPIPNSSPPIIDLTQERNSPTRVTENGLHQRAFRHEEDSPEIIDVDGLPSSAPVGQESRNDIEQLYGFGRRRSTRFGVPAPQQQTSDRSNRPPRGTETAIRPSLPGLRQLMAGTGIPEHVFGIFTQLGRAERLSVDFPPTPPGFSLPDMDFEAAAFPLGHASTPPRPSVPKYSSPPAAKEGFTRTLREDDVLVCPNCEQELGVGHDELQRQVWAVRLCGHVRSATSHGAIVPTDIYARSIVGNVHRVVRKGHPKHSSPVLLLNYSRNALFMAVAMLDSAALKRCFNYTLDRHPMVNFQA